jgi:hypothetical protein
MAKAKVKLALDDLNRAEKIQLARTMKTSLTDNDNFTDPDIPLTQLGSEADALEAADADVPVKFQAYQASVALANQLDNQLAASITTEGAYIERASGGDKAKILSAGVSVKSEGAPITQLPAPQNLSATSGDDDGEVDLSWQPVPRVKGYDIEQCADPPTADGWEKVDFSSKSKYTVEDLTGGALYWFRVRARGSKVKGPWSDPAVARAA